MGKFTQSVRRIVQDVKDEGTMSGLSREEVIEINERLILFRVRLEASYETAKQALNSLITKYSDSKSQRNIFHRYPMLKIMIKVKSFFYVYYFLVYPHTSLRSYLSRLPGYNFGTRLGSNKTRNTILDTCRNPQARKTRNCSSIRDEGLFDYGKDTKVGSKDTTKAFRGSGRKKGTPRATRSHDDIADRTRKYPND